MIKKHGTYVVMGLLDTASIAFSIGQTLTRMGGNVIYTVQNERIKRLLLEPSLEELGDPACTIDKLNIEFCDVTIEQEVKDLFEKLGTVDGVVHSIAYANPKTCLGVEFHTDVIDDIKLSFHISCISLATVTRYAQPCMKEGGSIVALTFDSHRAYAYYNWMGMNKAALEALVRSLARRHGKDLVRINAVSAGPLTTKAASKIPGFVELANTWNAISPIPWDPDNDKGEVANMVAFLLGPYARKITGQTIFVDGGASIIGGEILSHERPAEK